MLLGFVWGCATVAMLGAMWAGPVIRQQERRAHGCSSTATRCRHKESAK